jgi:hypothetical protein
MQLSFCMPCVKKALRVCIAVSNAANAFGSPKPARHIPTLWAIFVSPIFFF